MVPLYFNHIMHHFSSIILKSEFFFWNILVKLQAETSIFSGIINRSASLNVGGTPAVTMCNTLNMEKRMKNRELTEEVRKKVIIKHDQPEGYKTIFKALDIPLATVPNIIKAHGTEAWMWPQDENWLKIEEKDCLNGGERAQENFKTDPSWPSSLRYIGFKWNQSLLSEWK